MESLWKKLMDALQQDEPEIYEFWFISLKYGFFDESTSTFHIFVPNSFVLGMIQEKFFSVLSHKMKEISLDTGKNYLIQLELEDHSPAVESPVSESENIPREEYPQDKSDSEAKPTQKKSSAKTDASDRTNVFLEERKNIQWNHYHQLLNPRFTFDNFISNQKGDLVLHAAMNIAKQQESVYLNFNPFFVYGDVGLGKTHIVQSIGNYVLQNLPHIKVIYTTAEQYINQFIQASIKKNYDEFRSYYRNTDILIIDDVQFLELKEKSQEEIFNTFNYLHNLDKQIIFTCDKHPKKLKNISQRLISRFSWGLTIDMKPPDLETRKKIFIQKFHQMGVSVEPEICDFLAQNISKNVREIESAVKKLASLFLLQNRALDLNTVKEYTEEFAIMRKDMVKNILPENIIQQVCDYFQVQEKDIISKKKEQKILIPRYFAIYLCYKILNLPLTKLGEIFGNRDHTTIIHTLKKMDSLLATNHSVQNDFDTLMQLLQDVSDFST